jgi:hypothetical protein
MTDRPQLRVARSGVERALQVGAVVVSVVRMCRAQAAPGR